MSKIEVHREPSPPTRIVIRDAAARPVVMVTTGPGTEPTLLLTPQAGAGTASLSLDEALDLIAVLREMCQ